MKKLGGNNPGQACVYVDKSFGPAIAPGTCGQGMDNANALPTPWPQLDGFLPTYPQAQQQVFDYVSIN